MKTLLDSSFHYTRSVDTDLRKTFAKIRRRQREELQQRELLQAEVKAKVSPIKPKNLAI
jgi:hypothetical protein